MRMEITGVTTNTNEKVGVIYRKPLDSKMFKNGRTDKRSELYLKLVEYCNMLNYRIDNMRSWSGFYTYDIDPSKPMAHVERGVQKLFIENHKDFCEFYGVNPNKIEDAGGLEDAVRSLYLVDGRESNVAIVGNKPIPSFQRYGVYKVLRCQRIPNPTSIESKIVILTVQLIMSGKDELEELFNSDTIDEQTVIDRVNEFTRHRHIKRKVKHYKDTLSSSEIWDRHLDNWKLAETVNIPISIGSPISNNLSVVRELLDDYIYGNSVRTLGYYYKNLNYGGIRAVIESKVKDIQLNGNLTSVMFNLEKSLYLNQDDVDEAVAKKKERIKTLIAEDAKKDRIENGTFNLEYLESFRDEVTKTEESIRQRLEECHSLVNKIKSGELVISADKNEVDEFLKKEKKIISQLERNYKIAHNNSTEIKEVVDQYVKYSSELSDKDTGYNYSTIVTAEMLEDPKFATILRNEMMRQISRYYPEPLFRKFDIKISKTTDVDSITGVYHKIDSDVDYNGKCVYCGGRVGTFAGKSFYDLITDLMIGHLIQLAESNGEDRVHKEMNKEAKRVRRINSNTLSPDTAFNQDYINDVNKEVSRMMRERYPKDKLKIDLKPVLTDNNEIRYVIYINRKGNNMVVQHTFTLNEPLTYLAVKGALCFKIETAFEAEDVAWNKSDDKSSDKE